MALAKRVFLFLVVNFLVVAVISFILYLFNFQPFLSKYGLNYTSLIAFCLLWGMGGALISLMLSKVMAKWMMGVKIIDPKNAAGENYEILQTVYQLATKAGLPKMPEVGIFYSNEPNAFATGPSRSNSLVAISSGLLQRMRRNEVEAVIGHEITHIANGDMVTMTLLQGIVNAFVMFFARILAFALSSFTRGRDESSEVGTSGFYWILVFVFEMVFMLLGSIVIASYSRRREYRADLGGSKLSSPSNMINALIALKRNSEIKDPEADQPAFQALKISNNAGLAYLFASHPPLDERITFIKRKFRLE